MSAQLIFQQEEEEEKEVSTRSTCPSEGNLHDAPNFYFEHTHTHT